MNCGEGGSEQGVQPGVAPPGGAASGDGRPKREMGLDSANRSVLALLVAPYLLLGHFNGGLVVLIAERLATGGVPALDGPGEDLRPALVVLVFVALGLVRAAHSLAAQLLAGHRLAAQVECLRLPLHADLQALAAGVGLADGVDVVDCDDPVSFTHGLGSSRVVLSRGLVSELSHAELAAVLEHEGYHVRNRDPLKILLARALPPAFFYLPALRGLETRYALARELAADHHALEASGRRSLTGALYRVVTANRWSSLAPAAGLGGPETLEARLTQLETGSQPVLPRLSRRAVLVSAGVVTLFAAVLVSTLVCVADLPDAAGEAAGREAGGVLIIATLICPALWLGAGWLTYHRLFRRQGSIRGMASTVAVGTGGAPSAASAVR